MKIFVLLAQGLKKMKFNIILVLVLVAIVSCTNTKTIFERNVVIKPESGQEFKSESESVPVLKSESRREKMAALLKVTVQSDPLADARKNVQLEDF